MADKKSKKHDVMISYNWDSKETVVKIREVLRQNGISCWIDIEHMTGSTNDAMSEAVENCTVFLMCYSAKYAESRNCKSEAEYAQQKDKTIIPCKMERGFVPKGWLGFLLGSKLFFEFSEKYPFDKKMKELLREIQNNLPIKTAESKIKDGQENVGNGLDREKEKQKEQDREREKQRELEREKEKQRELEREKEKQKKQEIEKIKARALKNHEEREREGEREKEQEREKEKQRKQQIEKIKARELERRKEREKKREREGEKQTLTLCSSVTKLRDYTIAGIKSVYHISLGDLGILWASDPDGNIVQTDLKGNLLQKITTLCWRGGYHTVTQDWDLLYTDAKSKVIHMITQDNVATEFTREGFNWKNYDPLSIYSSRINGDILVGMSSGMVIRHSITGKEIQTIEKDSNGQKLYDYPFFITESINGDICVSDSRKNAVIVVNKSGQFRFSYKGQGSRFCPRGLCTDPLGHIVVCDYDSKTVLLLDQDGQLLSHLLTDKQGVPHPWSISVDDENNLHVGQYDTNSVQVFKFLQ